MSTADFAAFSNNAVMFSSIVYVLAFLAHVVEWSASRSAAATTSGQVRRTEPVAVGAPDAVGAAASEDAGVADAPVGVDIVDVADVAEGAQVVDAVDIPVVAAGGHIAERRSQQRAADTVAERIDLADAGRLAAPAFHAGGELQRLRIPREARSEEFDHSLRLLPPVGGDELGGGLAKCLRGRGPGVVGRLGGAPHGAVEHQRADAIGVSGREQDAPFDALGRAQHFRDDQRRRLGRPGREDKPGGCPSGHPGASHGCLLPLVRLTRVRSVSLAPNAGSRAGRGAGFRVG